MKRLLHLLLIAYTVFPGAMHAQPADTAMSNTYAVVVGISQYQNPSISRLMYADKDATLFANWLQSKAGGSVPGYQVKLFTNENATIANVYAALDWLKKQAKKNDLIYFYFSGHGDIETRDTNSQGYLLAWNSPATNYRNNAISVADINENANHITTHNNAKVIIISDACHSGKMAGDFYKGRQLTAANLQLVLNNQVRLASCEAHQQAAEGPGWGEGRGMFSWYLLMGLQGMAAANNQGVIQLNSLQTFLDTSFKKDHNLALEKHQQNPVIDGNPLFPMALVDSPTLNALKFAIEKNKEVKSVPAGLQSLKTLGLQPIDYFFSLAKTAEIDTVLHFENYSSVAVNDVPFKIISDYLNYLRSLQMQKDSLQRVDSLINYARDSIYKYTDWKDSAKLKLALPLADSLYNLRQNIIALSSSVAEKLYEKDMDILQTLQRQLQNNKYSVARFNEKLVQLTHEKSQQMINAYLNGDLAELERRQYYYAGSRQYRSFLPVLDVAIHVAPETNYLSSILKINRSYIAGLVDRLEMARSTKRDSLLQSAFAYQKQALAQEPYAAYIYNELGNLFLQQQSYDSAAHYFDYALVLSPAWAVPWSNKIRLNLALNKLAAAKEAIHIADSLQPNLAFVNVNAGLVMEKDSNWLAAEAYYLNAIAQNNVHYLPFERVGLVYIHTGRYALADSFLIEAKNRKDAFAVNELSFQFGIEQGGNPIMPDAEADKKDCETASIEKMPALKPLIVLEKALEDLIIHNFDNEDAVQEIKKAIATIPGLPLANHYLGRKYFSDSNWVVAEQHLNEAIRKYLPVEQLKISLKSQLEKMLGSSVNADNNCLLTSLINYQYDEVEDHYMLGKLFEMMGRWDEAINQYQTLAAIENHLLMDQAVFKGFKKISVINDLSMLEIQAQKRHYEIPVRMGGTLKAARLLEKQGNYEAAEQALLKQVELNRKAGYARQAEMNNQNFGPSGRSPFNYFWLDANYDLEAETYNFYIRMLALFPRDAGWYERAGMFLYERLHLTYSRIPIAEQKMFYEYSKRYSYPYKGGVERATEFVDEDGIYHKKENKFELPVTGEEINIEMSAYDPLKTSLSFLTQAVKFSGEKRPEPLLVQAMARLQQWMGNADDAIACYDALLKLEPDSHRFRNAFIELLEYYKRLPVAVSQLDSLHKRGTLTHEQTVKLAYYKVLNKQEKESIAILDKYKPTTTGEKNIKTAIYIQQLINSGQFRKALRYSKDSLQTIEIAAEEDSEETALKYVGFDNPGYTTARMYAFTKKNGRALTQIRALLDAGFNNIEVLRNDPALVNIRKSKKWKSLWAQYDFAEQKEILEDRIESFNYQPVHYRIPRSK